MNALRSTLCLSTAVAVLGGCVGSQPPIGAPGAMPQSRAIAQHTARRASSGDLIYAVGGCGGVCVLSYPDGALVSSITLSGIRKGACSDDAGNVFVTHDTQVVEYSHGGTTPIATLSLPGNSATGCAIDPTTGNLAVVFTGNNVNVAVFGGASQPTAYDARTYAAFRGYDDAGNLFVSGSNASGSNMATLTSICYP